MVTQDHSHYDKGGPLLECLLILTRAHGVKASAETLLAGLPLQHSQLTPSAFSRSAKRAGFTSKIVSRDLLHLNPALFPAILLLENNSACVILELNQEAQTATVVFPDLGSTATEISLSNLIERYAGRVIYSRPQLHFDARATTIAKERSGHWFWSVISEQRNLYRDVLLTAFIINMFALASPLFVMNVYDRVVPNHATDTLWVLALGIALMISADFGLRMMRSWFVDLAASRTDVTLSATIMERVLGLKLAERPISVGAFAASLQSFESIRSFISSATVLAFVDLPFVLVNLKAHCRSVANYGICSSRLSYMDLSNR